MVRQLKGWLLALVTVLGLAVIAEAQGGYGWRSVENGVVKFWGTAAAPRTSGGADLGTATLLWNRFYATYLTGGTISPVIENGAGAGWNVDASGHWVPNATTNTVDVGTTSVRPRTLYAGTSVIAPTGTFATAVTVGGANVALGVAASYKVARGTTALDGSNPTTVATGLTTVVSCTATLIRSTGLDAGTAEITHATPSGANVDFYGWVILGTASTGTESFDWICVGT